MGEDKPSDEQYGYHLFPQRDVRQPKRESLTSKLYGLKYRCKMRLGIAMDTSPHVKLLLDAMKQSGCTAFKDRHFACEECDGSVCGGFDSATSEALVTMGNAFYMMEISVENNSFSWPIVLCQNNINDQPHMNRVVTHELIHAFDHCRAHVDFLNNVQHLACSEIRAASLSGDCSLTNEVLRLKFGVKQHHQTCVRDRAVHSIMAARKFSQETAEKAVDEVFDSCFNDQEPFGRIPHTKTEANMAYREFKNRGRYYANI